MSNIRLDIDGTRRHARRQRLLLRAALGAGLLLALVLALLPSALSTSWGNALLLRSINARIAGVVTLDEAWTGWLSGSGARQAKLVDPEGEAVFEGVDLDIDTGFFGLLWAGATGTLPAAEASASLTAVNLWRGEDGRLNLARSLGAPEPVGAEAPNAEVTPEPAPEAALPEDQAPGDAAGWREKIRWAGGGFLLPPASHVTLQIESLQWRPARDALATLAEDLEASFDGRDPDRISASLVARTRRAAERGSVDLSIDLLEAARGDGVLSIREGQHEMDARGTNVPLAALAEMAGIGAWAQTALGETATFEVTTRGRLGAPQGQAKLWTPRLDGELELVDTRSGVAATPASHLRWTLTPEGFGDLFPAGDWTLEEPAELNLNLASLQLPDAAAGAQPEWASTGVEGAMEDVRLRSDDRTLTFVGPRIRLESAGLGQRIEASVSTEARRLEASSPVVFSAALLNAKAPEEAGLPQLEASLVGFPTELLSVFGAAGAEVAGWMGPTVNVEADALQVAPAGRLRLRPAVASLRFDLASAGVNGPIALRFGPGDGWGVFSTPEPLRLELTDERIGGRSLLGSLAEVRLDGTVAAKVDLRELSWRFRAAGPPQAGEIESESKRLQAWLNRLFLEDCGLSGSVAFERATLRGNAGGLVTVSDLLLDVAADRPGGSPEVFFNAILTGERSASGSSASPVASVSKGSLTARVKASGLLDMKGRLQLPAAVVRASAEGRDLSVDVLDRLVVGDGRLTKLLGPVFQPSVHLEAGPGHLPLLSGTFESEHGLAGLTAELEGGELKVLPGAQLQLAISERGADALRGRLHPLTMDLESGVLGDPARLVPPAGVVFRPWAGWQGWLPLFDGAMLDAGGLRLSSDGWLASTLAGAVQQRVPRLGGLLGRSIELQAEPTRIQIIDGTLAHGPLWLWSERLAVGLRGEVVAADLRAGPVGGSTASRLAMTIGVPGVALSALVPEFTGLAPANVYELPLTGWIDNPMIDLREFQTELLLAGDGSTLTSHLGDSAGWRLPSAVRIGVRGFDRAMNPDAGAGAESGPESTALRLP